MRDRMTSPGPEVAKKRIAIRNAGGAIWANEGMTNVSIVGRGVMPVASSASSLLSASDGAGVVR